VLCKHNERDVEEINPDYIKDLKFHYVDEMVEVVAIALEKSPIKKPINLKVAS